jgi:uncharacterized oligopeptide transporter (OPT) family protein
VATLLLTSLIFLLLGWVGMDYRVTALSVAAIVCVAASNAGTTSQDLKTGYLIGATPRAQQIGLLVGALTSALVIGYTLNYLNDASTVYTKKELPNVTVDVSQLKETEKLIGPDAEKDSGTYHVLQHVELQTSGPLAKVPLGKYLVDDSGKLRYFVDPGINGSIDKRDDGTKVIKYTAPKARLMSLIIDGILNRKLPWGLVLLGVFISVMMELCGVASLPFAVGVYLPISASTPIFVGGLIRWLVDKRTKMKAEEAESSPGVLLSSGLIAGGSLAGIGLALLAVKENWGRALDMSEKFPALADANMLGVVLFLLMGAFLYKVGVGSKKKGK